MHGQSCLWFMCTRGRRKWRRNASTVVFHFLQSFIPASVFYLFIVSLCFPFCDTDDHVMLFKSRGDSWRRQKQCTVALLQLQLLCRVLLFGFTLVRPQLSNKSFSVDLTIGVTLYWTSKVVQMLHWIYCTVRHNYLSVAKNYNTYKLKM